MQEADSFDPKNSDRSVALELGDYKAIEASVPVETTSVGAEIASPTMLNREGVDVNQSYNENALAVQSISDSRDSEREENQADSDQRVVEGYGEAYLPEGSSVIDVKSHVDSVKSNLGDSTEVRSLCHVVHGNSLDLVQLAEVLKGLPEGDFRYLIKSREIRDYGNLPVPKNEIVALSATLQEQLYLANISKDFFHLQLLEQRERQTDRDLDECRSELENAISEKLNFQNLYHDAKEECVEFSAKVDELKIKLDESVAQISSLSADMANSDVILEAAQLENEKLLKSLALVSEQRNEFEEVMKQYSYENEKLSLGMADSDTQLATLEQEITNLKMTLSSMTDERKKFEEEKDYLFHEKEMLSEDLADCRRVIVDLQQVNSGLNTSLAVFTEESKKLKDHEEFLAHEFERLSTELVVYQDKVSIQHQEHVQLEAELKEAMSRLEQMAEENIFLHSSLEIYKARVADTDSRQFQLSSVGTRSSAENSLKGDDEAALQSVAPAGGEFDGISLVELPSGYSEGSSIMRGCLEEAEKIMQKLEKAVDYMHSHSVSLSRSSGKGVSKLIQAFESKGNVDDNESEENPTIESVGPLDPYVAAKEQISCLGNVLQALVQNVKHVDTLVMDENNRCKAAVVTCGQLEVEVEALKDMSNNLEARNIELEVICGAMNQHAYDTEAKKTQLEDLCESLKSQYAGLQLQNIKLVKKLTDTHSRVCELQIQLKEIQKSSAEVASTILSEVETMQREMRENIFSVGREWSSSFAALAPIVQKLDSAIQSAVSYSLPSELSHDLNGHFSFSVNSACEVIENCRSKLEAHDELSSSYRQLEEKLCGVDEERSLAIGLLRKISADLMNLLNVAGEHFEDSEFYSKESYQQDPLDAGYYEALVARVGNMLGDIQLLKESNSNLSTDLFNRVSDIEELNKRCLDTDSLLKLCLDVKEVLKVQDTEVDIDDAPVSRLQSAVSLLIQKYLELEEQASLSIKDINSRVMEFNELQGYVELLNSSIIQQQNDILVLRESLVQAKDGCDAMQTELLNKVKELEQSEQRVASVREKLSIAVAKGKGLVVQRDSLKHSLAEMSSELEKCSQELQLKDARLLEVEEKLKDYSEAGERMEALESELTYIRNSATALRESFFLKDSILQRIEEILEDLELPDHYHSKDTIEKVDWLAKTVAGNSFPAVDWDQRSSVGGGSYSDAGFAVTDGGKDDVQPTSNVDDDLRRKYEELQTKFYELAEQNDMLEQSLTERNILVQRWEEILDRINTPTQIRSMEPEERIHWLGTALSEADHHMRSLQQKIEKLENYCESLSNDLDESQRKIYELESAHEAIFHEKESALSEADEHMKSLQQKIDSFESYCSSLSTDVEESRRIISKLESSLQAATQGNEILSSSLVTLTTDHEIAMHTAVQYELELDTLRNEVDVLQGNLVKKLSYENQMNQIERDLKRLQILILDVLQDSGVEDESPDVSSIQVLERLIRKLVNHDREIDAEGHDPKPGVHNHIIEHAAKELTMTHIENEHLSDKDVMEMDDSKSRSRVHEGQNIEDLRRDLAEALDELVTVREERDVYLQKNQFMLSEIEDSNTRKKEFQELLNQEEQKSASLREKLNLAVRKGKSLVQQRDGLKQNIEEMTAEIDRLKFIINNHEHSLVESGQKISDLSLELETYKAFEAENLSLNNRLKEAEQHLQLNSHTLSMLLSKLGEIHAGEVIDAQDPLQKLEGIVKLCSDLQHVAASSEQEAKKSKRSAELLLAELNEVQERNDGLQEELERAYDEISNLSKERDIASSAKIEALSHLGKLSEERENQRAELERLKSSVHGVKKVFFDVSTLSDDIFAKDLELLLNVKARMEPCMELGADSVRAKDHGGRVSVNSRFKDFWSKTSSWGNKTPDSFDEGADFDIEQHLQQLTEKISDFKERIHGHSMSLRTEIELVSTAIGTMLREIASQRSSLESIKGDNIRLESIEKEKDMEGIVMRRSISLLYEACTSSIMEIEDRKAQLIGDTFANENLRINLPALPIGDGGKFSGDALSSSEESVKSLADRLLVAVKDIVEIGTKSFEGHNKELKSTILDLQKELQEKDSQRERLCMELVSQIKEAEATAANCSRDLQSMTKYAHDLEDKLEALGNDRSLLEQRVAELQHEYLSSTELGEKVKSLTDTVAAKEQEIEALMQALEEEENQMESLRSKVDELEKAVQQKSIDLEHVEASRAKALKKLSVTVSKFDELHHMSEGLLSEVENLQTQLQDRDREISFLRQEVTRCTNDVLEVTKMAKERSSGELYDLLTWLDTMFSGVLKRDAHGVDDNVSHVPEYKEHVERDITCIISELKDLRVAAQNKDTLLQAEQNKIEELLHRKAALEASLHEKELYLNSLQGGGVSGLGTSEIVEVEPMMNKWTSSVTSSQVRSLRKVNNDQVAIAIDADAGSSGRIEDEEDEKVHGFKSLTTSRFIPRFTRPVSDMIDGLWVSCDRALMRQPALRLGIMIYWAVLHAFLASFIV
ncbi:hypothetical protein BVRB_2g045300 [Beta vulgaris subsp. vulgaris]|uniref:Uncharacterized protein n=2 Tax=Beta vulgaris subsp. vulgaris TaxID=3555 RepID=A0A0J8BH72_BETVV|nr:trans-Golgi network-localized SYP41-interacting protein 1 isoform X3 [Beta vulgaris subsp. vulgaris]KMS99407.1 hypothetical protein BVRB_2g045300 [Beta vulgaris subsp. vulgaris]